MANSKVLLGAGGGLLAAAVVFGGSSNIDVAVESYHCVTDQPGKYPVKILASDTGTVYREGSKKRFEVDKKARTCSYTDKSGDTFVFHMK